MTLRGYFPLPPSKPRASPTNKLGFSSGDRRNRYGRPPPAVSQKVRMPRGTTKLLTHGTFEANSFDADQEARCSNVVSSSDFKDAIWPWWCRLQRDQSGTALKKDSYLLISCRIFKLLLGSRGIPDQKLLESAELDWQTEMLLVDPLATKISQRHFYRSMFQIADMWALSNDIDELCTFLGELFVKIQRTVGFHFPRSDKEDCFSIFSGNNRSTSSLKSFPSQFESLYMVEESNRWPDQQQGKTGFSFGLRRPIPLPDTSSFPGPTSYKPKYTSIASVDPKGSPGKHGAAFGCGPKSWTDSMAFASMAGHAGFLNPPYDIGWPTLRDDDGERPPLSFWRPTPIKPRRRTKSQKYYDQRNERRTTEVRAQSKARKLAKSFPRYKAISELKLHRQNKLHDTATLNKFADDTTNAELWAHDILADSEAQKLLLKIKKNPSFGVLPVS
jgi:hypothetical protein